MAIAFPVAGGEKQSRIERLADRAGHYWLRRTANSLRKVENLPAKVESDGICSIDFSRGENHLAFKGWQILDARESAQIFDFSMTWGDGASPIIRTALTRYDSDGISDGELIYDSQLEDLSPDRNTLPREDVTQLLHFARQMAIAPSLRLAD